MFHKSEVKSLSLIIKNKKKSKNAVKNIFLKFFSLIIWIFKNSLWIFLFHKINPKRWKWVNLTSWCLAANLRKALVSLANLHWNVYLFCVSMYNSIYVCGVCVSLPRVLGSESDGKSETNRREREKRETFAVLIITNHKMKLSSPQACLNLIIPEKGEKEEETCFKKSHLTGIIDRAFGRISYTKEP